jgi:hypothetical protein
MDVDREDRYAALTESAGEDGKLFVETVFDISAVGKPWNI